MSKSPGVLFSERTAYDEPAGADRRNHAVRAFRGDTVMQQQGPNGMGGPLRGTSVWWHGRSGTADTTPNDEPSRRSSSDWRGPDDDDPTIRQELVDRVRREIAAGDYDTQDRWEAALDRLLDRLNRD